MLHFASGSVLSCYAGPDGDNLTVRDSPCIGPFSEPLSSHNLEFVRTSGRGVRLDVTNESPFSELAGHQVFDVAPMTGSTGKGMPAGPAQPRARLSGNPTVPTTSTTGPSTGAHPATSVKPSCPPGTITTCRPEPAILDHEERVRETIWTSTGSALDNLLKIRADAAESVVATGIEGVTVAVGAEFDDEFEGLPRQRRP